jgi:predicted nucleic acid-binding protein
VADASALVDYVLRTDRAGRVEQTVEDDRTDLQVPSLCDVEVAAALRRGLNLGRLSGSRASEALQDYLSLPLTRHGHQALLARVVDLRSNFSAYDAIYVSLAERLAAPLLTSDDRLAGAARTTLGIRVLPPGRGT